MSKKDLLLEIGLEEMPARFVTSSIEQLTEKVQNLLNEKKISFADVVSFSTPRRLAVIVKGVATAGEDMEEEVKGPARKIAVSEDGDWTKAAVGFTRGQGVSIDDIYFKEINGVEYVHVRKYTKGQQTSQVLTGLERIVTDLTFPKNMRWANETLRYIRPIKWMVALFGQEVIPFTITGVQTSNQTWGHRFLGQQVTVTEASEYEKLLLSQYVIANASERKEAILSQLTKLEEENGWVIPVDEDLLEEVNNLVEYPTALSGGFDSDFLELPEEVLITSMKEHQRYFPVKNNEGNLLPFFVTVRNGDHNHLEMVSKGNEKVLKARLSDAAFFYREDQKLSIEACLSKLSAIVYHEEIGTLAEKVARVRKLTNQLSALLALDAKEQAASDRAAEIAKFDLVTHMVYEFPELQGFMGEKYALQKGENLLVAKAVNEHYMPRNAEDGVPSTNVGAVLSLAEKLDTIVSFFAIGNIPSGSQDPYALRRQASGIVQILIEKDWSLSLEQLLHHAITQVAEKGIGSKTTDQLISELTSFFKLRIKHALQETGVRYDIIDAVLAGEIGELSQLTKKAYVLQAKVNDADFKETIEALSRVITIAQKAEELTSIDETLFENEQERNLFAKYKLVSAKLTDAHAEEYFSLLTSLREEINQFFDHTMVMAEDRRLRVNRLSFMDELSSIIKSFAQVNEILTK